MWCETGNLRWGDAIDVDVDVVFWRRPIFSWNAAKILVRKHSYHQFRTANSSIVVDASPPGRRRRACQVR